MYDALLLVSFGGPEGPDDVMPFLQNVTRGRGVPQARLEEVAEHYRRFGGVSPINQQCRDLLAAIREIVDLPVYWGNRNWNPLLSDTLPQMAEDGIRHAAAFITSAYSSASSCRQYLDDIAEHCPEGLEVVRLRHYFDHPGFIAAMIWRVSEALVRLPPEYRESARLVFTAHSIPAAMAATAGPRGGAYEAQLRIAAGRVASAVGQPGAEWDLVWQSRSGPPHVPWLKPDVDDHLTLLAQRGIEAAVLVPIGFVSDHMEVVYDLDVEALAVADKAGLPCVRAGTAGTHPSFVSMIRELLEEPEAPPCPVTCCRLER